MKKSFITLFLSLCIAIPCLAEDFTLGMIQQHIHAGMPQSEVITCIGAPNLVTKNAEGCETWVYDKSSQSTRETYDKHWFWLFLTGRRRGCKSIETTQKTITVTLNFNSNACLENFTYNSRDYWT